MTVEYERCPQGESVLLSISILRKDEKEKKMKKFFAKLMVVVGIIVSISMYAESTADFIDRINKLTEPVITGDLNTLQEWNKYGVLKQQAVWKNDWPTALFYGRKWFNLRQGRSVSFMEADSQLEMSMLLWNNNNIEEAKATIQNCINVLKNDQNIDGNGCQRVEMFYALMRENKLPRPIDGSIFYNLKNQILEIAQIQWKAGLERMKNQNDMFQMFRD